MEVCRFLQWTFIESKMRWMDWYVVNHLMCTMYVNERAYIVCTCSLVKSFHISVGFKFSTMLKDLKLAQKVGDFIFNSDNSKWGF